MSNVRHIDAYVDGSYNSNTKKFGGGVALYIEGIPEPLTHQVSGNDGNDCRLRNVAGEVYAAIAAITIAQKVNAKSICINYDYAGIEKWVTPKRDGGWTANKKLTQNYQNIVMTARQEGLVITFNYTPAHTGIAGNELADKLAKGACK